MAGSCPEPPPAQQVEGLYAGLSGGFGGNWQHAVPVLGAAEAVQHASAVGGNA